MKGWPIKAKLFLFFSSVLEHPRILLCCWDWSKIDNSFWKRITKRNGRPTRILVHLCLKAPIQTNNETNKQTMDFVLDHSACQASHGNAPHGSHRLPTRKLLTITSRREGIGGQPLVKVVFVQQTLRFLSILALFHKNLWQSVSFIRVFFTVFCTLIKLGCINNSASSYRFKLQKKLWYTHSYVKSMERN